MADRTAILCPWPGCSNRLPRPQVFMCIDHWRSLPRPMQSDIRRSWIKRVDALDRYTKALAAGVTDRGIRFGLRAAYDGAAAEHEAIKRRVIEAVAEGGTGR